MSGLAMTFESFPRMDPAEAGRAAPTGYGRVEGVRLPCIVAGASSQLAASVDASDTTLTLADASRFPDAPFTLQAGYEQMTVTAVNGNTLTLVRGVSGTDAAAHIKGEPAFEVPSEYVYLISDSPVHSVGAVYIDRVLQRGGMAAYTGQTGDSHPDWPGKAVVVFSADAFIGQQRNLRAAEALLRRQGQSIEVQASLSSAPELADCSSSSYITLCTSGQGAGQSAAQTCAWAAFASDALSLNRTFKAVVENPSASAEAMLKAVLSDSDTGAVLSLRDLFIPAQSKIILTLEHPASCAVLFSLTSVSGDVRVYSMACTNLRERTPSILDALLSTDWPAVFYSDARLADGISSSTLALSDTGTASCFAAFGADGPGEMYSQSIRATLKNPSPTSAATVALMLLDAGSCVALSHHTLAPLAEETLTLSHQGGGWDSRARVRVITGTVNVSAITKTVEYITDAALAEVSLKPSSAARIVLGMEVTADVSWSVDTSGDYSGAGLPIERPDHVIRHFLVERMGFSAAEIDTDSFDAAGAQYASAIEGGYCFGFVLDGSRLASEWLRLLARECRSTLRYTAGRWRLDFIPDAAPAAAVIIDQSELAGEGAEFTFSMQPMRELSNLILGKFQRNMSPGARESAWLGTLEISDAASIVRYGTRVMEVKLDAV